MTGSQLPITALAVVIPVHNEESLLSACLESVREAVQRITLDVVVVASLDRCVDGSAAVAQRFCDEMPLLVVDAPFGNVGATRDAGVRAARCHLTHHGAERIWVANTDADTVVPNTWLHRQCSLADSGLDLVLGTVEPGPALPHQLSAHRLWFAEHILGEGHPHVHGANLGIRLSYWEAAGGFGAKSVHEDVALAKRVRELEGRWLATDTTRVVTSSRRHSKIPTGFAHYLRELDTVGEGGGGGVEE